MVTNPMRGSRTSRNRRREISPLMRSDTRSVRVLTASPGAGPAGLPGASGEVLDLATQDLAGDLAFDLALDRRKGLLQGQAGRRDSDDPQRGALPEILMIDLGDRNVVMPAQAVFEAAQDLPLFLKRTNGGQMGLDDAQRDGHVLRPGKRGAGPQRFLTAIFSTLNPSMTSPIFTSLKLARPIPHSYPAFTSLTSSLNRLRDDTLPVYTTTLSRNRRTSALRVILPSDT